MERVTRVESLSPLLRGTPGDATYLSRVGSPRVTTLLDGFRREWPLTASPTTDDGDASGTPMCGRDGNPDLVSPYWRARLDAA